MSTAQKNTSQKSSAAFFYMTLGMLLVPLMDGTAKILVETYPVTQVVWGRYFFHLLSLLPLFAVFRQRPNIRQKSAGLQIIRAFFLLIDTALFFAALAFIPLANGTAVFFTSPLIMTALAPFILNERVGYHRWIAVIAGFIGTVFILNPKAEGEFVGYLLAFGAAVFYALYLLLTRKLTSTSSPLNTLLFTALIGTAVMTCTLPFNWIWPDLQGWLLFAVMGLLGTGSHFFIIKAFAGGDASLLAPIGYTEIISATVFGVIVFGHFPDFWTWIGITIVIASGFYILQRQRLLTRD